MKRIKNGKLYSYYLNCPDIDKFLLVRICRKLGIHYIPFTLKYYDELYLREDVTKYARLLVNYCKQKGIRTYVVQEGANSFIPEHMRWASHIPLHADYLITPDPGWWINRGIPKRNIIEVKYAPRREDCRKVVFMAMPHTFSENLFLGWFSVNVKIMQVLEEYLEKDAVFKLHNINQHLLRPYIPDDRIVEGEAKDIIRQYDEVYTFGYSSVCKDCEMAGKKYTVL